MKGPVGLYTCKICGRDFALVAEERHTVRDKTGLSTIVSGSESELYDAFDCPHCGCQNVIQNRKRIYDPLASNSVDDHDGCAGCRYEDYASEDYPCSECSQNCTDHYEIGEGTEDGK